LADLLLLSAMPSVLPSSLPAGLAVFLNSLGELTAYDSDGDMLWQVGHAMHARLHPCANQLCNLVPPPAPMPALCLGLTSPAAALFAHVPLLLCAAAARAALCGHHLG
jgi:hypothetical protein